MKYRDFILFFEALNNGEHLRGVHRTFYPKQCEKVFNSTFRACEGR